MIKIRFYDFIYFYLITQIYLLKIILYFYLKRLLYISVRSSRRFFYIRCG